ncbi:hypothetical protein TVAG_016960 [Trichomonas vaginalis G3]|uniref:DBF4-type domain-containing protein n=1 Tax=Trichomonas vaginalis (strain ATCC PRA-98 / G3) TaxID=412133 RepID=A2ER34_TRIV3|nr:DBF zinc finger family [Trichomonas vaginalis G3]EAY04924.1 hypothetical protein TVAG_016960 [Trichomonas vaginalis G3]KAI5519418.1 DBF zinc finger family [Trichomonas vaginalis G3]|eukprot:XP_001317147.1 hypothetical protein [Trichomonas vaginalis G3]
MNEAVVSLFDIRTRENSSRVHIPTSENNLKPKLKIKRVDFKNPDLINTKSSTTETSENVAPVQKEPLGILHPNMFTGLKILIRIQDTTVRSQVAACLSAIGAKICPENFPAVDAVVSDRPIRLISTQQMNIGMSRGNLLAAQMARHMSSSPQVILLSQIPWANVQKPLTQASKIQETQHIVETQEATPFVGIVVADDKSCYKPLFKQMNKMPVIFDNSVPRGYYFTPFTQPPKDPSVLLAKFANYSKQKEECNAAQMGPSDNGFCELCGCSFKNAQAHRMSPEHVNNMQVEKKWAEFDALSDLFLGIM